MKKIAVIGASGMVASRFVELVSDTFEITPLDERTLDITDQKAVEQYFTANSFNCIINFAAYTNVDAAEVQKGDKEGLAWRLNVDGPRNLKEIAKKRDVFLVHISTDFVFPGNEDNPGPYDEDSELPNSQDGLGWYAWTKNRAEAIISSVEARAAIIRYGYPFRADPYDLKLDWARKLLNLYNEQKLYPLFYDQTQSILFIDDLSEPLVKIVNNNLSGVFHIASSNITSPYESGKYLLERYSGRRVEIKKESVVDFFKDHQKAPRPRLGGLASVKTQKVLEIKFDTWQGMIDRFIKNYKKET